MNGTPTRSVMARSCVACRSAWSRLSITHGPPMKTNGRRPPRRSGPTQTSLDCGISNVPLARHRAEQGRLARLVLVLQGRANEALEHRVAVEGARFELGMKLAGQEERV